ncbi:MAG: hypothetical protein MJD61_20960 [Proteobacteria bacterium]|nr:hypothetical protein [Pseudomonadota bacterium]
MGARKTWTLVVLGKPGRPARRLTLGTRRLAGLVLLPFVMGGLAAWLGWLLR